MEVFELAISEEKASMSVEDRISTMAKLRALYDGTPAELDEALKKKFKPVEDAAFKKLKEFEDKVLRAEERAKDMEYEIFTALKDEVAAEVPRILATARALAEIDVLAGLAQTAATRRYCAPTVDGGDRIEMTAPCLVHLDAIL